MTSTSAKHYTIQVLISEDNLLIKFNDHSLPPIRVAARSKVCGSAAAQLLGLRVRIPPVVWMSVSCECCVSSGRGLCDGLITRPEEFYGCLSVVSVVCRQVEFSAPELITRPEASYRTVMRCCV